MCDLLSLVFHDNEELNEFAFALREVVKRNASIAMFRVVSFTFSSYLLNLNTYAYAFLLSFVVLTICVLDVCIYVVVDILNR